MLCLIQVTFWLVVALISPTVIEGTSEFGCTFEDANYKLTTEWKGSWPNDPIYGKVQTAIPFKTEEEFKTFYKSQEEIRKRVTSECANNELDPFIKFFDDFKASGNKDLKAFFKTYAPQPDPARSNSITCLLKVYKELVKKNDATSGSFVLGSIDVDVGEAKDNKVLALRTGSADPPAFFQHDGIVGVVKFTIAGKLGYIIIDMGHVVTPSPVLMDDAKHSANKDRAVSVTSQFRYSLSPNSSYVVQEIWDPIKGGSAKVTDPFEKTPVTNVIYIGKSLCSFILSVEKPWLLNPLRTITKFNDKGGLTNFLSYLLESGNEFYSSVDVVQLYSSTWEPTVEKVEGKDKTAESNKTAAVKKPAEVTKPAEGSKPAAGNKTAVAGKKEEAHNHDGEDDDDDDDDDDDEDDDNNAGSIQNNMKYFEHITDTERSLLDSISESVGLGKTGLYERMSRLYNIWKTSNNTNFIEQVTTLNEQIRNPSSVKTWTQRMWDNMRNNLHVPSLE